MKKVLLINAHQPYEGISPGNLNAALAKVIQAEFESQGHEVKLTEIAKGYDINEEVSKHLWADIIILQSPVFWFGNPWIYKKYADEVFMAGLVQQSLLEGDGRSRDDSSKQYGTGGKLQGKKYMLSLTWNAPKESFGDENQFLFAGKTVDDVFVANTANYKFCGVDIVPSFSCHDVVKQPDVENDIKRLKKHLRDFFLAPEPSYKNGQTRLEA
ncbi:NAD(P)H-dependent oxidoreductase [Methylophilus flavus]|uniref:NAD(P)H-dependent oxidoreductase n=1 Tax=Methylophilus flavus TaxID=640084 RepID=A0ABW3PGC5_9PROT